MQIRERALYSKEHTIKIKYHIITVKRLNAPLISFNYNRITKKIVVAVSKTKAPIEIEETKIESLKKKALAFIKHNVTYDDGRSI